MKSSVILTCLVALLIAGSGIAQRDWYEDKQTINNPGPRFHHGMAWDGVGVVLYGGHSIGRPLSDTWYRIRGHWYSLNPSPNPGQRWLHGMVADTRRNQVILVAGTPGYTYRATYDTWTWDQSSRTWFKATATAPQRLETALAYDSHRDRVMLFGGYKVTMTWIGPQTMYYSDLYEYNPSSKTWTTREQSKDPRLLPSRRYGAAMAYDPVKKYFLFFGGYAPGSKGDWQNDTWQLSVTENNVNWKKLSPVTKPPARSRHQMVYDPSRGRFVMTCGHTVGNKYLNDTWEWDGTNWIKVDSKSSPSARQAPRAVYDPSRNSVTLFGGYVGYKHVTNDTWELYTKDPASTWPHGTGGKGSHNKVPVLSARTKPVLGKTLQLGLADALPNSWTLLAIGATKANLDLGPHGAPGCTLYPLPAMLLTYQANATGSWTSPPTLAVPAVPALAGFELHFQVGVFDAKANALGMITSNALGARSGY